MTQWHIAQLISDRSNPIVIKEVRQAVKSKAYIGLYLVLLFVCVVISLFACGSYLRSGVGSAIGDEVFGAFLVCLWITGFVLMPMGAFHSLAKERTENTFELLNISGLGPGKIVRGKLGAAIVQLGLIYSAFVPFMAFTYFLRGIDLPMMIFFIVSTFLISVCTTASVAAITAVIRPINPTISSGERPNNRLREPAIKNMRNRRATMNTPAATMVAA